MSSVVTVEPTASTLEGAFAPERVFAGTLHIHVAFDWGDEVDLEQASRLVPATRDPVWKADLTEECYVFHLAPEDFPPVATLLSGPYAGWVAGLRRLESGPRSQEEIAEALRLNISYSPTDLLTPDWASAV